MKNLIAINFVQLQINFQLILDFNLENFTRETTSMIATPNIAATHRLLWPCMHNIIYMYWFSNQVLVGCMPSDYKFSVAT